jgi:hypothetical protein
VNPELSRRPTPHDTVMRTRPIPPVTPLSVVPLLDDISGTHTGLE